MATLNAGMEGLLISKGYTSNDAGTGLLDLIKASPSAVTLLNQFAVTYGVDSRRIDVSTSLGTSFNSDRRTVIIAASELANSATPEARATNVLRLIHEVKHAVGIDGTGAGGVIGFESARNPIEYRDQRSMSEGLSQSAEFAVREDIKFAKGIDVAISLKGGSPEVMAELDLLASDLRFVGKTEAEVASAIQSRTAAIVMNDTPGTEPLVTYGSQDVRDYMANVCGLPQKNGSWSYIAPPEAADMPVVGDYGLWSGRLRAPIGPLDRPGSVQECIREDSGRVLILSSDSRKFTELVDLDGNGTLDEGRVYVGASLPTRGSDGWLVAPAGNGVETLIFGVSHTLAGTSNAPAIGVSGITAINGHPVPQGNYADPQDLEAWGFTWQNVATGQIDDRVVQALDPATLAATGQPVPTIQTTTLPNGTTQTQIQLGTGITLTTIRDASNGILSTTETKDLGGGRSTFVTKNPSGTVTATGTIDIDSEGATVTKTVDPATNTTTYSRTDAQGNPIGAPTVVTNPTNQDVVSLVTGITALGTAIRTGNGLAAAANGITVLTSGAALTNATLPAGIKGVGALASGALTLSNLANAFRGDDDLNKVTATLNAANTVNNLFQGTPVYSEGLSTFLNGSTTTGVSGVGAIAALNLVSAVRNEDPIGVATSLGTLIEGASFLTSNPVGWALLAASFAQALFADDVPDAWGTANVTFGPGITNLTPTVNATGDSFGPDRVRAVLEKNLALLNQSANSFNSSAASNTDNGVLQLGIIPQRISSITWRANEFQDQGYAVVEVDRLTGQQRNPTLRFDDQGRMFNLAPEAITPQLRDLLAGAGSTVNGTTFTQLDAYLYNAAIERRALAPRWEVDTARAQTNRGDPDAGLSVEERAAKHGLGNAGGVAGSFRVIGLDLDRDGRISTSTAAQNNTASRQITFDWDASGFQKTVGWVGANDGFLVLDQDVNRVAGNGAEMFNNPLVAEAGRGLRLLEAYDANGDGIINAADPVYGLLQVWRDLDQDGNNLQVVNGATVQDSTNGQFELTSLASAGITGIDYNNSRYLSAAGFGSRLLSPTREWRSKAGSRAKLASSPRGCFVSRYQNNSIFLLPVTMRHGIAMLFLADPAPTSSMGRGALKSRWCLVRACHIADKHRPEARHRYRFKFASATNSCLNLDLSRTECSRLGHHGRVSIGPGAGGASRVSFRELSEHIASRSGTCE